MILDLIEDLGLGLDSDLTESGNGSGSGGGSDRGMTVVWERLSEWPWWFRWKVVPLNVLFPSVRKGCGV